MHPHKCIFLNSRTSYKQVGNLQQSNTVQPQRTAVMELEELEDIFRQAVQGVEGYPGIPAVPVSGGTSRSCVCKTE
jgi:hypothetical protein